MKTFKQFIEQRVDSGAYRHLPSRPSWINDVIINDAKKKKNKKDFYKFDVKSKSIK